MLIVALVLAVIGLAALVTAVVTSNELIAWVCIAASVIGVVLLIVDALRERRGAGDAPQQDAAAGADAGGDEEFDAEYPDEPAADDHADAETTAAPTEHVDDEVAEEERPR